MNASAAIAILERPSSVEAETEAPAHAALAELRAEVEAFLPEWVRQVGDALDESELREVIRHLIGDVVAGRLSGPPPADTGTALLRRRVLDLLRTRLIDTWSSSQRPPDADVMLATLRRFERVREQLEPKPDQCSASRLLGPDGVELVVDVAHDLRSPLTSILFLSETLRRGQSGELNDIQHRQLGIIYSAALGLISVASDMTELARSGNQLTETQPSPFSVSELLESVRAIVQPMSEEKGLTLRLVPPESDRRVGYPLALNRVLLNLTTNALKFTDAGLVEITACDLPGNRVELSVHDTGHGIDEADRRTLFQPFRRSSGRRGHHFSGSGLGLMISRRLVEAMGGQLDFETQPGCGTRFFFTIELPEATL